MRKYILSSFIMTIAFHSAYGGGMRACTTWRQNNSTSTRLLKYSPDPRSIDYMMGGGLTLEQMCTIILLPSESLVNRETAVAEVNKLLSDHPVLKTYGQVKNVAAMQKYLADLKAPPPPVKMLGGHARKESDATVLDDSPGSDGASRGSPISVVDASSPSPAEVAAAAAAQARHDAEVATAARLYQERVAAEAAAVEAQRQAAAEAQRQAEAAAQAERDRVAAEAEAARIREIEAAAVAEAQRQAEVAAAAEQARELLAREQARTAAETAALLQAQQEAAAAAEAAAREIERLAEAQRQAEAAIQAQARQAAEAAALVQAQEDAAAAEAAQQAIARLEAEIAAQRLAEDHRVAEAATAARLEEERIATVAAQAAATEEQLRLREEGSRRGLLIRATGASAAASPTPTPTPVRHRYAASAGAGTASPSPTTTPKVSRYAAAAAQASPIFLAKRAENIKSLLYTKATVEGVSLSEANKDTINAIGEASKGLNKSSIELWYAIANNPLVDSETPLKGWLAHPAPAELLAHTTIDARHIVSAVASASAAAPHHTMIDRKAQTIQSLFARFSANPEGTMEILNTRRMRAVVSAGMLSLGTPAIISRIVNQAKWRDLLDTPHKILVSSLYVHGIGTGTALGSRPPAPTPEEDALLDKLSPADSTEALARLTDTEMDAKLFPTAAASGSGATARDYSPADDAAKDDLDAIAKDGKSAVATEEDAWDETACIRLDWIQALLSQRLKAESRTLSPEVADTIMRAALRARNRDYTWMEARFNPRTLAEIIADPFTVFRDEEDTTERAPWAWAGAGAGSSDSSDSAAAAASAAGSPMGKGIAIAREASVDDPAAAAVAGSPSRTGDRVARGTMDRTGEVATGSASRAVAAVASRPEDLNTAFERDLAAAMAASLAPTTTAHAAGAPSILGAAVDAAIMAGSRGISVTDPIATTAFTAGAPSILGAAVDAAIMAGCGRGSAADSTASLRYGNLPGPDTNTYASRSGISPRGLDGDSIPDGSVGSARRDSLASGDTAATARALESISAAAAPAVGTPVPVPAPAATGSWFTNGFTNVMGTIGRAVGVVRDEDPSNPLPATATTAPAPEDAASAAAVLPQGGASGGRILPDVTDRPGQ